MLGIIIVGAGQAAGQAAASLRQEGYEGSITLFGEEPQAPYQRPPLSKAYLSGELAMERVLVRPEKFYTDKSIELHTGTRIETVNPDNKTVTANDGQTHSYDKLLLATGSRPRILNIEGSDLAGIHYLRTIDDVDGIRASMANAERICIVGGGYIGLEVAAVANKLGLQVTVLEMEDRILQRVTTPEMSAFYHELHSSRGVEIRTGTRVSGFGGEGRVTSVICGDEEISAELVIVGIGIIPNVELAEAAGITLENGIKVDEYGRTSAPNVYAAGDCASLPYKGERIRLESVQNAIDQADNVAANIMGQDVPYVPMPWFWSDQYDIKLQIAGLNRGYDAVYERRDADSDAQSFWYYHGDTLLAVDAINDSRAYMVGKRLIEMGKSPTPQEAMDPETNLKALLKK